MRGQFLESLSVAVHRALLVFEFLLKLFDFAPELLILEHDAVDLELGRIEPTALFVIPLCDLFDLALAQEELTLELVLSLFETCALSAVLGPRLLELAKLVAESFQHGVFLFHVTGLGVHETAQMELLLLLLVSSLKELKVRLREDTLPDAAQIVAAQACSGRHVGVS